MTARNIKLLKMFLIVTFFTSNIVSAQELMLLTINPNNEKLYKSELFNEQINESKTSPNIIDSFNMNLNFAFSYSSYVSIIKLFTFKKSFGVHFSPNIEYELSKNIAIGIAPTIIYSKSKVIHDDRFKDYNISHGYTVNDDATASFTELLFIPYLSFKLDNHMTNIDIGLGFGYVKYNIERYVQNITEAYDPMIGPYDPVVESEYLHSFQKENIIGLKLKISRRLMNDFTIGGSLLWSLGLNYTIEHREGWSGGPGPVQIWEEGYTARMYFLNIGVEVGYRLF